MEFQKKEDMIYIKVDRFHSIYRAVQTGVLKSQNKIPTIQKDLILQTVPKLVKAQDTRITANICMRLLFIIVLHKHLDK